MSPVIASNGIAWAQAWPYVGTGYVLAVGLLGGYGVWVVRKLRRAERSLRSAREKVGS
ncbi:MAG TPA: hypothetical protein VGI86_19240 [Acidimicrobiia bacterium]|jgi:hypothetical protein